MKLIFCIIGISLITGQVLCFDLEKVLEPFLEECNKELGISEKDKPDLKDPKFRCYGACVLKKLKMMENGKLNEQMMIESLENAYPKADNTQKSKIKECVSTANTEKDECEVFNVTVKCVQELGLPKDTV
uniref:Odorant-binding protein 5 n=1 Tax=Encarsia formosa TaxID=32400 RepID=A0A514TTW9_ENCFO|nr:odorant-binding protein 5 [Encarsia formosa]